MKQEFSRIIGNFWIMYHSTAAGADTGGAGDIRPPP